MRGRIQRSGGLMLGWQAVVGGAFAFQAPTPDGTATPGSVPSPRLPETVIEGGRSANDDARPMLPPPPSPFTNFAEPPTFVPGRFVDLIGLTESASQGTFDAADIADRAVLRPAEVLELIPGMIVTQHSGSGKANQYFVRGINLDHGTDFAARVDGVPINLPTHAHGQGYLDLNWLIPEMIERGDYKLGPYYADVGDFSAAGTVDLRYKRKLDHGLALFEIGNFDYYRTLTADSVRVGNGDLLYAVETVFYDGPWDLAEDFNKFNGTLRYTLGDDETNMSWSLLAYRSYWNATNQIPQGAVDQGLIGRFGTLDPSDAGETSRVTGNWELYHEYGDGELRANAYVYHYDLDLYSNFTYFLDDPVDGDQFQQRDRRTVSGFNLARTWNHANGNRTLGFQFRNDDIYALQLNRTVARSYLSTIRNDDVNQQSWSLYAADETRWTDSLRTLAGARGDAYRFDVTSLTDPADSNTVTAGIFSPKLGVILDPYENHEFYFNWGQSFHSNDARGVTAAVDPSTPLVKSEGSEIGWRAKPLDGWNSTLTLWHLEIDSELVFVGDAGTTEPATGSRRTGITTTQDFVLNEWALLDVDYAWVRPRFFGGDRIPNAVENVLSVGLNLRDLTREEGAYLGVRLRHYGPAALVEDNSARSGTTTVVNLQFGRQWRRLRMGVDIFNLFDSKDNDITYFYESQPAGLPAAEDFHFHPLQPVAARAHLAWKF